MSDLHNPQKIDCTQCGWLGLCTVGCPYPHPERIVNVTDTTAPKVSEEFDEVVFEIEGASNGSEIDASKTGE